jgi:hypothetical protein
MLRTRTRVTCRYWTTRSPCIATKQADLVKDLGKVAQQIHNLKIWSTSTTEERERIKDFWLGLGEPERRNLVKIEKDTVLRKMKEQQKHSCSCAVCGRKRSVFVHLSLLSLFCNPRKLFFYMSFFSLLITNRII